MAQTGIPRELDWVRERAACTVAKVFHQLCEGVIADVEAVNLARQLPADARFTFEALSNGVTAVVGRIGMAQRDVVRFGFAEDRVVVSRQLQVNRNGWQALD